MLVMGVSSVAERHCLQKTSALSKCKQLGVCAAQHNQALQKTSCDLLMPVSLIPGTSMRPDSLILCNLHFWLNLVIRNPMDDVYQHTGLHERITQFQNWYFLQKIAPFRYRASRMNNISFRTDIFTKNCFFYLQGFKKEHFKFQNRYLCLKLFLLPAELQERIILVSELIFLLKIFPFTYRAWRMNNISFRSDISAEKYSFYLQGIKKE